MIKQPKGSSSGHSQVGPDVMLLTGIPGTMKKEAAVIYHRIRDEGNALHNLDCYAKGEGEIRTACTPRPSSVESKNFIGCSACKKFYPGKSFKLHKCLDSKKKPPTLADCRRALSVKKSLGCSGC